MAAAHPLPIQNHSSFETPQPPEKVPISALYDIAIIGGGASGVSVAFEASRTVLRTILFERGLETGIGSTRACSGIVHCGVHTPQGTLKADLEQKGRQVFPYLCKNLNVPLRRCGELVVARNEAELNHLQDLHKVCESLGVESSLWGAARVHLEEPNLADTGLEGALSIPSTSVVNPLALCHAMTNCAMVNGVEVSCGTTVTGIKRVSRTATARAESPVAHIPKTIYEIKVSHQGALPVYFYAKTVVNASGVDADLVTGLTKAVPSPSLTKRIEETYVLDTDLKDVVTRVISPAAPKNVASDGMHLIPTVDGTVLVGPAASVATSASGQTTAASAATTDSGRSAALDYAHALCPMIAARNIMYSFATTTAAASDSDFLIRDEDGFIQCAGIRAPGLTACPAIGAYVIEMVKLRYPSTFFTQIAKTPDLWIWYPITSRFHHTPLTKRQDLVGKDMKHSKIVCACEKVTEADIENAITEGARSMHGLKVRTRATGGRCQGSFCGNRLRKLLAARLGVTYEQVCHINHVTPVDKAYPNASVSVKLYRSLDSDAESIQENLRKNLSCGQKQSKVSVLNAFSYRAGLVQCAHAFDLVILGAGPAGLGAAIAASSTNPDAKILVITKDAFLGGSLSYTLQTDCGKERYKVSLTGPEFMSRLKDEVMATGAAMLCNTTVIDCSHSTARKLFTVECMSNNVGPINIPAKAVVSCLGHREKHRFNAAISGTRPYGVMTADVAQKMLAVDGVLPGRRVAILGSQNSGLLVARQVLIEGGSVVGIFEPESRLKGSTECLDILQKEFNVKIHYNKTVARIVGDGTLNSVVVANINLITRAVEQDATESISCDCLVTSLDYVPQTVIARSLGCKGLSKQYDGLLVDSRFAVASDKPLYAAGNNVHRHSSVDSICAEGEVAGYNAIMDISGASTVYTYNVPAANLVIDSTNQSDVEYLLPQSITAPKHLGSTYSKTLVYFKTTRSMKNVRVTLSTASTGKELALQTFATLDHNTEVRLTVPSTAFQDLVSGTDVVLKIKFESSTFSAHQTVNSLAGLFTKIVPVKGGAKECVLVKNTKNVPPEHVGRVLEELRQLSRREIMAPVVAGVTVFRNVAGQCDFVTCEGVKTYGS